jgi:DNA-binding NtrC family response regulator
VELRHATLSVGEERVSIEILDATADVRINGVPVRRADLTPVDEILLGDARLRLERSREPAANGVHPAAGHFEAEDPGVGQDDPVDWMEVVERLHDWSRSGSLDKRGAMLGQLVEAFGLRGAALVQPRSGGGLAAVNAWGEVADLLRDPWVESVVAATVERGGIAAEAVGDQAVVAMGRTAAESIALAVRTAGPAEELLRPLRLSLRFLAHELYRDRFRPTEELRGGRTLAFPPTMVVGRSPSIVRLYEEMRHVATHHLPVLLVGETGTGKGELARLLHGSGPRRESLLVAVDCAAPDDVLARRLSALLPPPGEQGKQRAAAGTVGTVVLDELIALSLEQQARVVGVLKNVAGADGGESSALAPRFVATMDEEPEDAIAQGRLRRDLFYRLAGFVLRVPPLRERREDIPLLFDHFLSLEMGPRRPALAPAALAAIVEHRWEGNLRELRYEASRLALRVKGATIELADLSAALRAPRRPGAAEHGSGLVIAERFLAVERDLIARALDESGHRIGRAAEMLGISRSRLRRRMRLLGFTPADGDADAR